MVVYEQLISLAGHLVEGEAIKISQNTASLTHWGRVIGLGFKQVAALLNGRAFRPPENKK